VQLTEPVWWNQPWKLPLYMAGFDVGSWLIAGIVLGALMRLPRGYVAARLPAQPLK
jgi:hypothetical protein